MVMGMAGSFIVAPTNLADSANVAGARRLMSRIVQNYSPFLQRRGLAEITAGRAAIAQGK
jgi:hypothetical protein